MRFDGALLRRGFWLYVWTIDAPGRWVLYVGRTGDSSSPHASSPFRRTGQHLDSKPTAKGSALHRHLAPVGLDPADCNFNMIAFGPVFPEQSNMADHKVCRDKMAAMERALADHLTARGHTVLGTHPRSQQLDHRTRGTFEAIKDEFDQRIGHGGASRC